MFPHVRSIPDTHSPSHQHSQRLIWGAVLVPCILAVLIACYSPQQASAQDTKSASVIVQYDAAARTVRSVEFTVAISGLQALTSSGLDVVSIETEFGPAVCSIQGVGCPADNCFCDANRFWSYSYWDGSQWQGYLVGAGSSIISQTGAIEGWRWGEFGAPQFTPDSALAAEDAIAWLQTQDAAINGASFSVAGETLLALGSNDQSLPSLVATAVISASAPTRTNAGSGGKFAVTLASVDQCYPATAMTPQAHFSPTLGIYSEQIGLHSWAVLGVAALGDAVPATAVDYLKSEAKASGGWEWAPGWGEDTNSSALAIQALLAAGETADSPAVTNGLAFLKSAQRDSGGFSYDTTADADADTNSTAYVVQALFAAGEDPTGAEWTSNGKTPIDYLISMQLDNGSLEWQPGTGPNILATQQAIPALLGRAYPLARATLAPCPMVHLPLMRR